MKANPYKPPLLVESRSEDSPQHGIPHLIHMVGWVYPFLLVAALYSTWGIAWLTLGHIPQPSFDDPSNIGLAVDVAYLISGVLLIVFPVAAMVGMTLQLSARHRPFDVRIVRTMGMGLLYVGVFILLRWDPLDVVEWFFD